MSILDGFKRKKKYLKTPDGYKLESYWTSSESVEFSDGKTAEEKLSGINGITDSLSDDSSDICLSSAAGNNLQKQVAAINSSLNSKAAKYTNKGSSTQPVYIDSNGVPTAIPYTIGKSVPVNAVFTDTNTWRGIQNNLTSTSTTDSLSAAQGKILNDKLSALPANLFTNYLSPELVPSETGTTYSYTHAALKNRQIILLAVPGSAGCFLVHQGQWTHAISHIRNDYWGVEVSATLDSNTGTVSYIVVWKGESQSFENIKLQTIYY